MATRMFGSSVARLEDPTLLTGTARFVDDITLPGMAEAAFVRSPHGHAAIRGIDKTAALDRPGIHAVLTLDDLMPYFVTERLVNPPSPAYKQERDRPALAANEVVHVGEPVAIVIADDRYIAEDAAALVEVDYDPLPAVSDCRAALADGAPLAHKDAPGNLLAEFKLEYGDVDAAFFVLSADSPIVRDLLRDEQLELLSFYRSRAYAQRYPFLESVVLARGVVDRRGICRGAT